MSTTTPNTPDTTLSLPGADLAHWIVRASLAGTFIFHGVTKFPYLAAGADMMGMSLWLWTLVAVVETAAGVGIVLGGMFNTRIGDLITRASGLSVVAIMVGAIYLVHWGQWSNIPSETHPFGGMEFQTLLLAIGAFFGLRGNRA
jgi:putative oxidoreductase